MYRACQDPEITRWMPLRSHLTQRDGSRRDSVIYSLLPADPA